MLTLILNTASLVVVDREVVVYILEGTIKEVWCFKATLFIKIELRKSTSQLKEVLQNGGCTPH